MGKVIAGMSLSLDGFVNDGSGKVEKLFPDFKELHKVPSFKKMIEETGAVIMGRHTYDMADPFKWANDDYEFQTPIFVLTHRPPANFPKGKGKTSFTFTNNIEAAVSQAKKAAGDKNVQVIGASTIQQCLNSGLCDELQVDLIPVILGKGLRLLENINTEKIKLQRIKVEEPTASRTSITFKVTNF